MSDHRSRVSLSVFFLFRSLKLEAYMVKDEDLDGKTWPFNQMKFISHITFIVSDHAIFIH